MSNGFSSRFDQGILHLLQKYIAKGRAFKKQSLEKSKVDLSTGELFTL